MVPKVQKKRSVRPSYAKTEEAKEKALKYFKEYYKCTLESHTRYVISTYLGAKTLEGIGKYKLERG